MYSCVFPTDSRGVQADHERLQAQTTEEVHWVPVHGAQLPGGPTRRGLEGQRLRHSRQGPGNGCFMSSLEAVCSGHTW